MDCFDLAIMFEVKSLKHTHSNLRCSQQSTKQTQCMTINNLLRLRTWTREKNQKLHHQNKTTVLLFYLPPRPQPKNKMATNTIWVLTYRRNIVQGQSMSTEHDMMHRWNSSETTTSKSKRKEKCQGWPQLDTRTITVPSLHTYNKIYGITTRLHTTLRSK